MSANVNFGQNSRFKIGWIMLLVSAALMTLNHLGLIFFLDDPTLFAGFAAFNLYAFLVILIPFRRGENGPGIPPDSTIDRLPSIHCRQRQHCDILLWSPPCACWVTALAGLFSPNILWLAIQMFDVALVGGRRELSCQSNKTRPSFATTLN
jgi:hypothetical protein